MPELLEHARETGKPVPDYPGISATPLQRGGNETIGSLNPSDTAEGCFHCGLPCPDRRFEAQDKVFCCHGCLTVHDLLTQSGLSQFYELDRHPGVRIKDGSASARWDYLDDPVLQHQILDFSDERISRATFHVPAIHCLACVWLLENLFKLRSGIGHSRVNFQRREVSITWAHPEISLSQLVALLSSIGYEPELTLGKLDPTKPSGVRKREWLQVGIAGFVFGNVMLFSFPSYLGLDSFSGPLFRTVFGYVSLALLIPVLVFSALDYWRSALLSFRRRSLTLEVPIAVGLAAIYAQSAYEIFSGGGAGYLDSLSGLIFFLLCGRVFQKRTQERIVFDRDYKSFFPLAAMRKGANGEESATLSSLRIGDRLIIRNGELIPADSRLITGPAMIDYSFVTGESEPVSKKAGDYLYAGGQQIGGAIEVEMVKPVSQSYLMSLWNHEAFQKDRNNSLETLTNRYSRRFSRIVLAIALGAVLFWFVGGHWQRGIKAFVSVLIVACPCALALAAPFTLGTAQRILARRKIFLRNGFVLERMADVDSVVLDKTGTLTGSRENEIAFIGSGQDDSQAALSPGESMLVYSLARLSTHPHAIRIAKSSEAPHLPESAHSFIETAGCGIEGRVTGHEVWLGSRPWLERYGVAVPVLDLPPGSTVYLAIDGAYRGVFVLRSALRAETLELLHALREGHDAWLLSGDNERERSRFEPFFNNAGSLRFNQSPLSKLEFIRELQTQRKVVLMAGDGLNDAGALKQSDVGVAVVEEIGTFSPASDVIVEAGEVARIADLLAFSRRVSNIVRAGFALSAVYNVIGIGIAAAGILSPIVCAILMPVSSISVCLFACGMTAIAARRSRLATTNHQ